MVSKFLARKMREHGHHHIKAKNTTLRDLQENQFGQDEIDAEKWKEAAKNGKLQELYDSHLSS